jgi:sn-glycerol 3-phosphate transport system substrate-binding protein
MANSRAAGKTWGIPFQRSTILLYWNKAHFRESGLDPEKPPPTGRRCRASRQRLTRREQRRAHHPLGRADPVVGLSVLAVPGPGHRQRRRRS